MWFNRPKKGFVRQAKCIMCTINTSRRLCTSLYATDDARFYIIEYKDDATAFNGEKKGTIAGKGAVNNRMSNILFRMLEANGVETHFVEELNDRETVVKAVKIVPLEVIVRNVAAGSFSKRFGVEEGRALKAPTLEYCLKNEC